MVAPPPLDLRIAPERPRTLAGESVVIVVAHAVHADLPMETVDLNEDRTRITITSLDDPGGVEIFSGRVPRALPRREPLVPLGRRFLAPANSAWEIDLDLSLYRRPLSAGRYRVQ